MNVALHHKNAQTIVAICDDELCGKTFTEGDLILDLSSPFYQGVSMDERAAGDILRNAHIVNLVGERSCALARKEEIITEKNISRICNVPFAFATIVRD